METPIFRVSPSFLEHNALYSDYLVLRYPKTMIMQYTQSIRVVLFVYFSCINGVYLALSTSPPHSLRSFPLYYTFIFCVYYVYITCILRPIYNILRLFFAYIWRIFGVYLVRVCLVIYMVLFDLAYRERK